MAYTEKEQALINDLREQLSDTDGSKNILDGKQQHYTDKQLHFFLKRAMGDVNGSAPATNFTFENWPDGEDDVLLSGAMVFAFMADGILQLRNNITYSDAGLSVNMFDKSGAYQQWAMFMAQQFEMQKREFKARMLPASSTAGFYGVRSPFSPHWGGR